MKRAAIPPVAEDENSNPNHKTPTMTETVDNTPEPITQVNKQLTMDQFLTKNENLKMAQQKRSPKPSPKGPPQKNGGSTSATNQSANTAKS